MVFSLIKSTEFIRIQRAASEKALDRFAVIFGID